jgi:hypothetical protein
MDNCPISSRAQNSFHRKEYVIKNHKKVTNTSKVACFNSKEDVIKQHSHISLCQRNMAFLSKKTSPKVVGRQ